MLYHEKQYKGYCRCHAINNLLGKKALTVQMFDTLCDEYDTSNNFTDKCSRNRCVFYNNGGTNNIFGFILHKLGYRIQMKHYDFYTNVNIAMPTNNTVGYIIYNMRHTYCLHIDKNRNMYIIDSMQQKPRQINNLQCFRRKNLGVIEVIK